LPPSRLDSVHVMEQFRGETLDSVYRFFSARYDVKIVYDTGYCKKKLFYYYYVGTVFPLAIEITTREQGLTYSIDSNLTVTIKRRKGVIWTDEGEVRKPERQIKAVGPPKRRSVTVSGRVVDFNSGEPISFATVNVRGTTIVTSANADGYFSLFDVPNDTCTLIASFMGYQQLAFFLHPEDDLDNLYIELLPVASMLSEVEIIADQEDLVKVSGDNLSMVRLSPKKMAELPNIGEKDIMRAYQLMPGVSAANESSAGLYVRGGTPDQNLVLYDGFTIYHVDHLYGFYSAFNANALKDVQLYKGGFDAKFGGRLSSVMDITGKEGNQKQFNLGGDLSLLSGNIFTEIPLTEKTTILAAYRRSWKGPIYNWIFNSFNKDDDSEEEQAPAGPGGGGMGGETKVTSYFSDLNAKVTYRATEKDNIAFSYFYSIDKLDNSFSFSAPNFGGSASTANFSNGTTDLTRYGNKGMSLKWGHKWGSKLYGNTILSYSNYYSQRDRTTERTSTDSTGADVTSNNGIVETNDLKDMSFKTDYDWDIFKSNQLGFGAFGTSYDIKYDYSQDDTSILSKNNNGQLIGVYLQDKQRFFNHRIEVKGGMRLSYFDVTKKSYKEPRAAVSFKLTDKLSLKGSYGQFYQFANRITREDILSGSKDFWILSDGTNVPVSSSTHYITGISYETKKYLFSVESYYKKLYDITEYSLRFTSNFRSTTTYNESFYSGSGYAKGLEFLIQKKTGKFTGWISYTLAEARNQFDVYGTSYYPANQDVTHEGKAVGIYKYKRWDFSATWVYATGRPYTAPGGSYQIELLDGSTQDYFTVTSKNSLRLPDYHRMDLSVNYHLQNARKNDIGYIGLSFFNVYNRTNIWYKQFYISGSEVYETDVNYLGLTPNLTLSLKIR
jgi:ferric enterobactin receptor